MATYAAPDSPPPSFNLTDDLTTPCDQDETKLDQAICDTFTSPSAVDVEYLNCSKVTDNYPNTVNLISDLRYIHVHWIPDIISTLGPGKN